MRSNIYISLYVRRSWHCSTDSSSSSNLLHENSTYILVPGTRLSRALHSFRAVTDMRLAIPCKAQTLFQLISKNDSQPPTYRVVHYNRRRIFLKLIECWVYLDISAFFDTIAIKPKSISLS